jgi:hypothetical protein
VEDEVGDGVMLSSLLHNCKGEVINVTAQLQKRRFLNKKSGHSPDTHDG